MDRREAIKRTSFLLGGAAFSAISISSLASCQTGATEALGWEPSFLSVDQSKIVSAIADILVPTTDTPGAIEAGVPEFIDIMLKDNTSEDAQKKFQEHFTGFVNKCKEVTGKSFGDCAPEEQLSLLQQLEKEAQDAKDGSFIGTMKQMTYQGYFTSEVGMMDVLDYNPVPGNYDGCVAIADM